MLVHSPEVIYTGCIESTADESVRKSSSYEIGFILLEISSYDIPTYIVSRVSVKKVHTLCSLA